MKKILIIAILVLSPGILYAQQYRGPQHFTITRPDGTMATGQYMPNTGQVVIQDRGQVTVLEREPNNNWRTTIEPAPRAWDSLIDNSDD